MEEIKIYTDGSCYPNPGPGGWAFALSEKEFQSGKVEKTTNQRMEITAILEAIAYFKFEFPHLETLTICTDSMYCINSATRWINKWKRNDWTNSYGQKISNRDLWEIYDELSQDLKINFKKVKSHSGDTMNDFVDKLAGEKRL